MSMTEAYQTPLELAATLAAKGRPLAAIIHAVGREVPRAEIAALIDGVRNAKAEAELAKYEEARLKQLDQVLQAAAEKRGGKIVRIHGPIPTAASIIEQVASSRNVSRADIIGPDRRQPMVAIRQEVMFECVTKTKLSLCHIGMILRRDHATVIHGVRRHAERHGLPLPRSFKPRRQAKP